MASAWRTHDADSPTLKRSFAHVVNSEAHSHSTATGWDTRSPTFPRTPVQENTPLGPIQTKRRSLSITRPSSMPVQTSQPLPPSFPSFMSVFGGSSSPSGTVNEEKGYTQHGSISEPVNLKAVDNHGSLPPPFRHRGSIASASSESTDSSPTTTISTLDSASVTDPSPSSSPESPTSLAPLAPFKSMMSDRRSHSVDERMPDAPLPKLLPTPPLSSRPESPGRRDRNTKNLSLSTTNTISLRPSMSPSSGQETTLHPLSAPSSPLNGPLKNNRRKHPNLTIRTPGFDKLTFSNTTTEIVPPTPSSRPALRHHESSPSLPSMFSPTAAPVGGMFLPPPFPRISRPGSQSSISGLSSSGQSLQEVKEEEDRPYDPPQSQEPQERGYPEGPVRIYDDGVHLYLEPTREEASKFDVIINVAKEVANPFAKPVDAKDTVMSVWRNGETDTDRGVISEPQTAISEVSFKSAFEWMPTASPTSPTTPKPETQEPEYIHVPWDHNSEILEDLYPLCELIDSRVRNGKSVLIHCQLGVSRSASLVIAYGLYKGYQPDFHNMYTSVKDRSQWVGPNMSLIYQLMDFRSKSAKGDFAQKLKAAPTEWFKSPGTGEATTPRPAYVNSFSAPQHDSTTSATTQTEFLLERPTYSKPLPPVPTFSQKGTKQSIPYQRATSFEGSKPGPIRTKSPSPTPTTRGKPPRPLLLNKSLSNMKQLHIPPMTPKDSSAPQLPPLPHQPFEMDLVMQDVPQTPSLFSPRATEFLTSPFAPTIAGDLASHGVPASKPPPPLQEDPRSPHQEGEPVVMRSIDDML